MTDSPESTTRAEGREVTITRVFDAPRELVWKTERPGRADWARIAFECGYYDQSHLINDFRAVTGRTSATFPQDTAARAA